MLFKTEQQCQCCLKGGNLGDLACDQCIVDLQQVFSSYIIQLIAYPLSICLHALSWYIGIDSTGDLTCATVKYVGCIA